MRTLTMIYGSVPTRYCVLRRLMYANVTIFMSVGADIGLYFGNQLIRE